MLWIHRKKYGIPKIMENYQPLIPELTKPIRDLTEKEAQEYFKWYVSHIDERCDYITSWISRVLEIPAESMDYSLESILIIEKFLQKVAGTRSTPSWKKTILKSALMSSGADNYAADHFLKNEWRNDLNTFTEYVCNDISMYIGKVFVTCFKELRWDYVSFGKSYLKHNNPEIYGFIDVLDEDFLDYIRKNRMKELSPFFHISFDPTMFVKGFVLEGMVSGELCKDCMIYVNKVPHGIVNENEEMQIIREILYQYNPAELTDNRLYLYDRIARSAFIDFFYKEYRYKEDRFAKRIEKNLSKGLRKNNITDILGKSKVLAQMIIRRINEMESVPNNIRQ